MVKLVLSFIGFLFPCPSLCIPFLVLMCSSHICFCLFLYFVPLFSPAPFFFRALFSFFLSLLLPLVSEFVPFALVFALFFLPFDISVFLNFLWGFLFCSLFSSPQFFLLFFSCFGSLPILISPVFFFSFPLFSRVTFRSHSQRTMPFFSSHEVC